MKKNEFLELETLVAKLDDVGDDETAIQRVFEESIDGSENPEELNEADLENVAGGIREIDILKWLINNTKTGKLTWTAAKVSAKCIYDYCKYGNAYKTYSKSYVKNLNSQFDELFSKLPSWMK